MMTHPTKKAGSQRERVKLNDAQQRAIAQRIRAQRVLQQLSQGELARRAGLDPASLNQIEGGKRTPDLASLYSLAEQLGVSPAVLLEDSPATTAARAPMPPQEPSHAPSTTIDLSAAISAAVDRAVGDLVATLAAALGSWYEAHISRTLGGTADPASRRSRVS